MDPEPTQKSAEILHPRGYILHPSASAANILGYFAQENKVAGRGLQNRGLPPREVSGTTSGVFGTIPDVIC
jgi:hypothetical protein